MRFFKLTTIFCLVFALSTVIMPSEALGCSGACCSKKELNNKLEKKTTQTKKNTCCSQKTKKNKPCKKGNCGGEGCPCPNTNAPTSSAILNFSFFIQKNLCFSYFLNKKTDFYYQNIIPKQVYLSFWQPPKVSVTMAC